MKRRNDQNYYVQDNLASKIEYLPELWEDDSFRPQVIEGTKKKVAIEVKKGYTILLFAVVVLFIIICAIYLKSAFSLIAVQEKANQLRVELQTIKNQNEQLENKINATVNLEKVYDVATNQLNMRLPNKDEIHYITRTSSSYTVKLNQVSYTEKNNNLRQFIIFILKDW